MVIEQQYSLFDQLPPPPPPTSYPSPSHASPSAISLRPYQQDAVKAAFRDYPSKGQVLLELPPGAGKSRVAQMLSKRWPTFARLGGHNTHDTLILLPSIALVRQMYRECLKWFPHRQVGIMQAGNNILGRPIMVASIDTLARKDRREQLLAVMQGRKFSLVIIDEAHLALTEKYITTLAEIEAPQALRVCLTGTPYRQDGQSLMKIARDGLVYYVSMDDLIAEGYLLKPVAHKVRTDLDLTGIELGEDSLYTEMENVPSGLIERIKQSNRYTKAYHSWKEIIGAKQTLIFADNIKDAYGFQDYFEHKGIMCVAITSKMPAHIREDYYEKFRAGTIPLLVSYGVLTTGVDFPFVGGLIIARLSLMGANPNRGVFTQIMGRGMRPWNDEDGEPMRDGHGRVRKDHVDVVFLTDQRHDTPPILMSMGFLPGSTAPSSLSLHRQYLKELDEAEGAQKKLADRDDEYSPLEIHTRLHELRLKQTDVFAGDGWKAHLDGAFTKDTQLGQLSAEREGIAHYGIHLRTQSGRKSRLVPQPLSAEQARAQGMQYVERQMLKEKMRQGQQTSASSQPMSEGQINHLTARRGLKLEGEWQKSMRQGDYFKIESHLKGRDAAMSAKKPWYIIGYSPQRGVYTFTPKAKEKVAKQPGKPSSRK